LAEARPLAFNPPSFDCPSALDQAGVLYFFMLLPQECVCTTTTILLEATLASCG
jgi:hypothetical protein